MDKMTKTVVRSSIQELTGILGSRVLANQEADLFVVKAFFTVALIDLRDLLWKSQRYAQRIAFTDDVITGPGVSDVTTLVKYVRDACCHIESENHKVGASSRSSFNVVHGRAPRAVQVGGTTVGSDYEDDVAFVFGGQRIYLMRHIVRAFEKAKAQLEPLLAS